MTVDNLANFTQEDFLIWIKNLLIYTLDLMIWIKRLIIVLTRFQIVLTNLFWTILLMKSIDYSNLVSQKSKKNSKSRNLRIFCY